MSKKAKKYCIAFGCLNTNKTPNISFFTLPKTPDRRRLWLIAIDRQDLINVENMKPTTYLVCSAHFDISSLNISTYREPKKDAVPNLVCFPIRERYVEAFTQTDPVLYNSGFSTIVIKQEVLDTGSVATQTLDENDEEPALQTVTSRKRKLSSPMRNPLFEPECSLVVGDEIKLELEY